MTTSPPSPSGDTEDIPTLDLAEAAGPRGLEVVIDGTNPGTVDFGQSEFEPVGGLTRTADQFTTALPIEDAYLVVVHIPDGRLGWPRGRNQNATIAWAGADQLVLAAGLTVRRRVSRTCGGTPCAG